MQSYITARKNREFAEMVKKDYSEAPITEREERLFELGYMMASVRVNEQDRVTCFCHAGADCSRRSTKRQTPLFGFTIARLFGKGLTPE